MNLLNLCWLKTKHYMPNIKKYILMAIKIYAIGMPILCIVFNMVVNPEFRTIEYKISSCLFRMSMFSIPILIGYLVYKILIPKGKISILSEIIRLIIAIPFMFIFLSSILFSKIFSSRQNFSIFFSCSTKLTFGEIGSYIDFTSKKQKLCPV